MTFLLNAVQHPATRSPIEGLYGHVYKELSLWQVSAE